MSYILDALKRADADRDRQRSAVPDLHTHSGALDSGAGFARDPGRRWIWGLGLGAAVAAGIVWQAFGRRDETPASIAAAPAATALPAPIQPPAAAPAAAASPALASPAPAPPSASVVAPPQTPTPARRTAPGATRVPPAAAVAPRAEPAARKPPTTPPDAAASPVTAAASTPGRTAPARLPTFAELPQSLRSQLPPLAVNGSVYSRTPASRLVILNGQVFREGDRPAEGLAVEEIRLKSTVLSFRGTRFELAY